LRRDEGEPRDASKVEQVQFKQGATEAEMPKGAIGMGVTSLLNLSSVRAEYSEITRNIAKARESGKAEEETDDCMQVDGSEHSEKRESMRKWYSLRDKVYDMKNLRKAFKRVKANRGAPGIDGETVDAFSANLNENLRRLHEELKTDTYQAQPVRRTYIEKDDGSKRPLGIPTVRDRVVQQALKNVLEPIFEPEFHPSSYGYRPGRSCQHAVAKAERFMNKHGLAYAADMDLSKCFDRLNHELIIREVSKKVSDSGILRLIRQFLEAGVMEGGVVQESEVGSPQGGVISPLLTNIYLDYFDQKMRAQEIRIVRYADDILVLAGSYREARENMAKAVEILETELKLVVNQEKTSIVSVYEGVAYLGIEIKEDKVQVHQKRLKKFKGRIKELTKRNQGKNLGNVIKEVNAVTRGWINYFRMANCSRVVKELMGWIRRRLRMKKMTEWKTWKALHKQLRRVGYGGKYDKLSVKRWRNSTNPLINKALSNEWFQEQGLFDMTRVKVGILYCYYGK
jgi:RNA-directed DNA polymerase